LLALGGVVGFAFREYALLLSLLCVAVIGGTWFGSQLLEKVSERRFVQVYRAVLTLIAIRLLLGEGLQSLDSI